MEFILIILLIAGAIFLVKVLSQPEQDPTWTRERILENSWGALNPKIICPHCQTKGSVRTQPVKRKKGISGAKATGALLTGGISMLATGLSRKEDITQAHCDNCKSTWDY